MTTLGLESVLSQLMGHEYENFEFDEIRPIIFIKSKDIPWKDFSLYFDIFEYMQYNNIILFFVIYLRIARFMYYDNGELWIAMSN